MDYYVISRERLIGLANQVRRLGGVTELLSPLQMQTVLEQVETGSGGTNAAVFPKNVVYYDNLNGRQVVSESMVPKKLSYENSTFTLLEEFPLGGSWGDRKTASLKDGTASLELCFQKSRTSDVGLERFVDNGFASSDCPGFTFGAWFCKTEDTTTWERMLFCYSGTKNLAFGLYLPAGSNTSLSLDVAGSAYANVFSITKGSWYHAALSFEPDDAGSLTVKAYINGALIAAYTIAYTIDFAQVTLSNCGSYPWAGVMKNAFMSWGPLSQNEIRQVMFID